MQREALRRQSPRPSAVWAQTRTPGQPSSHDPDGFVLRVGPPFTQCQIPERAALVACAVTSARRSEPDLATISGNVDYGLKNPHQSSIRGVSVLTESRTQPKAWRISKAS